MATDPRKRQKKLQKKAAARKEKKHLAVREATKGVGERFAEGNKAPILHCRVSGDVWDVGIGYVLLSRTLPGGKIAVAVFLLDRYCLGVKDAIAQVVGHSLYDEKFVRRMAAQARWQDVAPEYARKLVEGGVAYARNLGFAPHEDYHKARLLFGDIDAGRCVEEFEYGKDGKPLFMRGPYDTPERCRMILSILSTKVPPEDIQAMIELDNSAPGGSVFGDDLLDQDEEDFDDDEDGR